MADLTKDDSEVQFAPNVATTSNTTQQTTQPLRQPQPLPTQPLLQPQPLPQPNVGQGSFDLPTDLSNILQQYSAMHDRSAAQSQALTASLVQQIAAQSQIQSAKYANDRFEKSIRQDMLDSIEMLEPLGVNAEGNGNRDVNLWVEQVRQHCSHLFNEQDLRGKLGALVQNEKQVCPRFRQA